MSVKGNTNLATESTHGRPTWEGSSTLRFNNQFTWSRLISFLVRHLQYYAILPVPPSFLIGFRYIMPLSADRHLYEINDSIDESVSCTAGDFICKKSAEISVCIGPERICNNVIDCPLGDDEEYCNGFGFACSGKLICYYCSAYHIHSSPSGISLFDLYLCIVLFTWPYTWANRKHHIES